MGFNCGFYSYPKLPSGKTDVHYYDAINRYINYDNTTYNGWAKEIYKSALDYANCEEDVKIELNDEFNKDLEEARIQRNPLQYGLYKEVVSFGRNGTVFSELAKNGAVLSTEDIYRIITSCLTHLNTLDGCLIPRAFLSSYDEETERTTYNVFDIDGIEVDCGDNKIERIYTSGDWEEYIGIIREVENYNIYLEGAKALMKFLASNTDRILIYEESY